MLAKTSRELLTTSDAVSKEGSCCFADTCLPSGSYPNEIRQYCNAIGIASGACTAVTAAGAACTRNRGKLLTAAAEV